jgi:hypothetical protein
VSKTVLPDGIRKKTLYVNTSLADAIDFKATFSRGITKGGSSAPKTQGRPSPLCDNIKHARLPSYNVLVENDPLAAFGPWQIKCPAKGILESAETAESW